MATTSSRPTPRCVLEQGFVIQVVNSQVQISNGNLNKLTAPIPMEAFFGDFVNTLFDPLCSYNHSTGKWYMTEAVSDFATFSGVYIAVSTSSDPRSPWNIYYLDLGSFGGDPDNTVAAGLLARPLSRRPAEPRLRPVHDLDLDEPVRPRRVRSALRASVALHTFSSTRSLWRSGHRSRTSSRSTSPPTPTSSRTSTFGDCVVGGGPCWYSIQPADAANGRYDTRNQGTQWAMSALEFFGSGDNRIAVWQFRNTSSIGAFIPNIPGTLGVFETGHTTYAPPPLSAQPQT